MKNRKRKKLVQVLHKPRTLAEFVFRAERKWAFEQARRLRVLEAFSRADVTKEMAIAQLGLRDYAELLIELGEAGLSRFMLPQAQIEEMATMFAHILKES